MNLPVRDPIAPRIAMMRKIGLAVFSAVICGTALLIAELDRKQIERNRLEPLSALEAPLRMRVDGQDRIYLLTTQVERPLIWRSLTRRYTLDTSRGRVNIDLWALDAATLKPTWRSRISSKEEATLRGAALLGADGDTLWVHAAQPLALSVRDGRLLADRDALSERNVKLRGQMLDEPKYFGVDAAGAWLLDAQARHWRIDGASFVATPVDDGVAPARNPRVVLPARVGAGQMMSYNQQRGVELGDHWLGMFSASEMKTLQSRLHVAKDGTRPVKRLIARSDADGSLRDISAAGQRRQLWRADRRLVSAAPEGWNDPLPDGSPTNLPDTWGQRAEYVNFRLLPDRTDYLDGGLLALETYRGIPLLPREPDSVLILHRDRMGKHGQYRLARVAGPDGKPLWDALLPLTNLNAILPGERSLVLLGRWFQTDEQIRHREQQARTANPTPWFWRWLDEDTERPGHRDAYNDAVEHLVAIDTANGRVSAFDMGGTMREYPVSGASASATTR